jgi:hypothetical protein
MSDGTPKESRDTGTPELSRQRRVIPRLRAGSGYSYDLYVVDGSGPDRLLSDGLIDTNQHSALLSFTVLMHKANMLGPKSPSMERVTNSDPSQISQKVAEAMKKVGTVIKTLDLQVGRPAREEIVNLCMMDMPMRERAVKRLPEIILALREGLDRAYSI